MRSSALGRRWGRQRGAAAVFAAISIVAAVVALGLSVDLGRLYLARRDLQRTANMAALDATRVASGCLGPVISPLGAATAEALASVQRNGGGASDVAQVQVGRQASDEQHVRYFDPGTSDDSQAVEVSLARLAPQRLVPILTGNPSITLRAKAAAEALPSAQVGVGSYLANVNPDFENALLSSTLGGAVNLSLLSYQGLFNVDVPLGELAGTDTPEALRQFLGDEISARALLGQLADALAAAGNAAEAAAVDAIADASDAGAMVVPGDVFDVEEGFERPANEAVINAGQAVRGVAQAAAGDAPLEVPIDVDLPFATGPAQVRLRFSQPLRFEFGPAGDDAQGVPRTVAHNAQGAVTVSLPLAPVLGTPVNLQMFAEFAEASAGITAIECPRRGQLQPRVTVTADANVSRLVIGTFDLDAPNPTPEPAMLMQLNVLGSPIRITALARVDVGSTNRDTLLFEGPFPETQRIFTEPASALGEALGELGTSFELRVEGLPGGLQGGLVTQALQPTLTALSDALSDALNALDSNLLLPLTSALGATIGGADVVVSNVQTAQPVLFTR